ncbi:MAG: SDR family oxidoreductase [Myxococcota bacterium]
MSQRSSLSGLRVLVTGASRGIGRATTLALLRGGAAVLATARDAERLASLEREVSSADLETLAVDLLDDAGGARLIGAATARPLDGVVHSAGVCRLGSVEDTSAEALDLNWQVNFREPYLLTQALLPSLRAQRGLVVFINSGAGVQAGPGWSAYAASKHALRALANSLRSEEAGTVRVSTVYPGRTASDMQAAVRQHEGKTYDPAAFVQPEDVAAGVCLAFQTAAPAVVEEISIRPSG